MDSLLVIRLHPVKPVTGDEFENYLSGLVIKAYDVSYSSPDGSQAPIDTVVCNLPVPFSLPKKLPSPDSRIVQHSDFRPVPVGTLPPPINVFAVATAVIIVPSNQNEYRTFDVRLDVSRNGEVIHKQTYYNVSVSSSDIPNILSIFQTLEPVGLYLPLIPPNQVKAANILPKDGTVPNFAVLLNAVKDVLVKEIIDPTPATDQIVMENIKELTFDKCRHIAYEIIWDDKAYPLPKSKRSLEDIYTESNQDFENDRRQFEGDLLSYYSGHNAESDNLAKFIFSLSAAVWCEEKSIRANRVGFYFPIFYSSPDKKTKVILNILGVPPSPSFKVLAAYFYAVTAVLPPQISKEDRFKATVLNSENTNLVNISKAIDEGIIDTNISEVNRYQAVRRLQAHSAAYIQNDVGISELLVDGNFVVSGLVNNWLTFGQEDINVFWKNITPLDITDHLNIVLYVITKGSVSLKNAINIAFGVTSVNDLVGKSNKQWESLFISNTVVLPEFTKPGTTEERIRAFIRHLRKFFSITNEYNNDLILPSSSVPSFDRMPNNPLDRLIQEYNGTFLFDELDNNNIQTVLDNIFSDEPKTKANFIMWLSCIQGICNLTTNITPDNRIRFSIMEALWARGITSRDIIFKFYSYDELKKCLVGSIAYDYAESIWQNADISRRDALPKSTKFKSINPDKLVVNCIPPDHLSPFSSIAYLHELLKVHPMLTCDSVLQNEHALVLSIVLAMRRGSLENMSVTKANLNVLLPLVDIVNESLEYMVFNDANHGTVYNTSENTLGGHKLASSQTNDFTHNPVILFEALPEHSTPASSSGYDKLKNDFSSCLLPYSQPLDVSRTYLEQLGTSRFHTVRCFSKNITEFVLEPTNEPTEFQTHLWRYPVKIDIAIEYLKITPEEYEFLFENNITEENETMQLHKLYGFESSVHIDVSWINTIVRMSEFLQRTCLTYCEFIELWKSEFVKFTLRSHSEGFPECEPCCLEQYIINFESESIVDVLKKLIIFIRLWRKLQIIPNAKYTFTELSDICNVLKLFNGTNINPDFIRQLAAFQMFRDSFKLQLTINTPITIGNVGANRMHLLSLWVPESDIVKRKWAVEHLLYQIQKYAINKLHCSCRKPEFIKLLIDNLDILSELAGFSTNEPDKWDACPTHTLRFSEVLTKIYASEFSVGELMFVFTNRNHLQGDDPFTLQTYNEAKDFSFDLPDDDVLNYLVELRKKLINEKNAEYVTQWTWLSIENTLITDFGFTPDNQWLSIGQHFFPSILINEGIDVSSVQRQYRVRLQNPTPYLMWNTPPNGPFQYDAAAQEMSTRIPIIDNAVLSKLSRIRQLVQEEQDAVQRLYFLPRLELVNIAFMFDNFDEAEKCLIQESDENKRWTWFQRQFDLFYRRCHVIAKHLANHVANEGDSSINCVVNIAKTILKHLWADENFATTSWENDNGNTPLVNWQFEPNGGAFNALLGLIGTGMLAEYSNTDANYVKTLRWRKLCNTEVTDTLIPTILPSMNYELPLQKSRFITVRNGFAMMNSNGSILGKAEPFVLQLKGVLLLEQSGHYGFSAGKPTLDGEMPSFAEMNKSYCWRVILERGQNTYVLLAHNWENEEAPAHCSSPIMLKKGFYELNVELKYDPPFFYEHKDDCQKSFGFQLKYNAPNININWSVIPYENLFISKKDNGLQEDVHVTGTAVDFLTARYASTVRDIRRTYQRAFKAVLLIHRFHLSDQQISDDGQSELGYILSHPSNFCGQSYYRNDTGFITHKANYDLNFLPVLDNYSAPSDIRDKRVLPTLQRQQAMFDWWERLFDYTVMRQETNKSPEQPVWLLFHESAEFHTDRPADLVRHLGIDLRHDNVILQYYFDFHVESVELEDDRWAVRVWHSEKWIRRLLNDFNPKDIREAKPYMWINAESGNDDLMMFYRSGCIENDEPRRYEEIKILNNGLRQRGRFALISYLTTLNRISLPWGGFATTPSDLSNLLLIDVEAGICQKVSRIEEAISVAHLFVYRARLGLEQGFVTQPSFIFAWERRFATFQIWKDCKYRATYRENWIEWDELQKAKQIESFQFLESELCKASLTVPAPGGETYWNSPSLHIRPTIDLIQHKNPALLINNESQTNAGLNLMGTPDRHARSTWLSSLNAATKSNYSEEGKTNDQNITNLPMWLQGAVRLGTKFIRVAASGKPQSLVTFEPKCSTPEHYSCCNVCNKHHPALIDEYYFWIEKSNFYNTDEVSKSQIAELRSNNDDNQPTDWHTPEKLPKLLYWNTRTVVYLHWCRVHNGEFKQPQKSYEGVWVTKDEEPSLEFLGRNIDSLFFKVINGEVPVGISNVIMPGFRYDIPVDEAVIIPQITDEEAQSIGGLSAFPYFAWFDPGTPLFPPSMFSSSIMLSQYLRNNCRFEAASKWYELVYNPLCSDNTWHTCSYDSEHESNDGEHENNNEVPRLLMVRVTSSNNQDDGDSRLLMVKITVKCCCYSELVSESKAKERTILLHYLDNLLQWGDTLIRKNTPESFQHARLIFNTLSNILGKAPITVVAEDTSIEPLTVKAFEPYCAPINPRLMCLYTDTEDRIALIHKCMNSKRLKADQHNYFGNSSIVDCWKITKDVCCNDDPCLQYSPYRFTILLQKALEMANDVRTIGSSLLSAYEKGDAEYLSTMRIMHEQQLFSLTNEIRQNQWRESDWQVQALQKTKEVAQVNLRYYTDLINAGLNSGEAQYEPLTIGSTVSRTAGNTLEGIAQIVNIIPDMYVGFPCNEVKLYPGTKSSMALSSAGRVANTIADILNTMASLGLTNAGWDRRVQEWVHQTEVLQVDIEQIERQILAAERRRDYALRELNINQQQIENAAKLKVFLRDKFTDHSLYLWMQQESAAMHYQMCKLAQDFSLQCQYAYNLERGYTSKKFIITKENDNLRERLLFGEQLYVALRHMEKSYYNENIREYELTKSISLCLHFPVEFLQLKLTGHCEIDIPEWMFDLDYPGQYMRRLKNVTITIRGNVGPYTGVHCRLTLLGSKTRISPKLITQSHNCCNKKHPTDSYQIIPEDPRIVSLYAATEAIATSGGQNDSGMFELNFRDERYLPFEYSGAVSCWRIELPIENNFFNMETINDVILNLNFMAREGGEVLRQSANKYAQESLSDTGVRFFDIKHEFSSAWHQLYHTQKLEIQLSKNMFPYITKSNDIYIHRLEILFETQDDDHKAYHTIDFVVGKYTGKHICDKTHNIICTASARWKGLFHGVLEAELGLLNTYENHSIGTFKFPICKIKNAYLFIMYNRCLNN